MTRLSQYFSLEEATISEIADRKGINNTPSPQIQAVMQAAALKLEVVRSLLGTPLHINSWYRCPELNAAVGSLPTSQHIKGEAIDFIAPVFGDCVQICKALVAHKTYIGFDQLILEHSWIHISFALTECKPRGEVLSLLANGKYSIGLTDKEGKPV